MKRSWRSVGLCGYFGEPALPRVLHFRNNNPGFHLARTLQE